MNSEDFYGDEAEPSAFVELRFHAYRLEPAKIWADEHAEQGERLALLIMQEVHPPAKPGEHSTRSFHVIELCEFLASARQLETQLTRFNHDFTRTELRPMTFNELVPADTPCKTFAEFDFKDFDNLQQHGAADATEMITLLEAMFGRFVEELIVRLNGVLQAAGSERTLSVGADVVVLTAHRQGKWSAHVIVDPPLSEESVAWRTTRDCGNFVDSVVTSLSDALTTFTTDMSVYSDNHALRIYRASKPDEPARVLRDKQPAYSEETMLRSLVSCIRVKRDRLATSLYRQDEGDFIVLTSALIGAQPELLRDGNGWRFLTFNGGSSATKRAARFTISKYASRGYSSSTSARIRTICSAEQLRAYVPRGSLATADSRRAIAACNTHYCELRQGEHGKNHFPVYVELDMHEFRYRQSCMSGTCDRSKAQWHNMDDELRQACLDYRVHESKYCTRVAGINRCLFRGAQARE